MPRTDTIKKLFKFGAFISIISALFLIIRLSIYTLIEEVTGTLVLWTELLDLFLIGLPAGVFLMIIAYIVGTTRSDE